MVYNYKEYNNIFDTPAKKQQERVIVTKIMNLLNNKKYDDLEELISKNQNYQNFIKNNAMENVVKHFGNTLNEEDFKRILENLRILTKTKQDFEKNNIKTTNIDDKEYNSFKGENKTYFIDNSISPNSIEEQMKNLQNESQVFQTSDIKKNTENMFKELEENKKERFNLNYLNEINIDSLNQEEQALFQAAITYQLNSNKLIRIDIKKGVIVDPEDNIMKIEKQDGNYVVLNGEDKTEKSNVSEENVIQHQKQFVLTSNPNTIYTNNE